MRKQTTYYLAVALGATVTGLAAVTSQSLWIDEGAAALKAMQPTLQSWWEALRLENNSNLQLIFQLGYIWLWEKAFGASEWALRASNIPWFVLGTIALFSITRERKLQVALILAVLSNAFLWYYLSEARPYIVLFAFSSITTTSFLRLISGSEAEEAFWVRCLCLGTVGLAATSMVAVPWALAAFAATAVWVGQEKFVKCIRRYPFTSSITGIAFVVCGIYYLWTIKIGARASDVGRTSIWNLGFIFYELSGLAGLGPGRIELRQTGLLAFGPYLLPVLIGGVCVIALCSTGLRLLCRQFNARAAVSIGIAAVVPLLLVFAAAVAQNTRLLARHVTPLLPYLLVLIGFAMADLLFSQRIVKRLFGAIFLLIAFYSALEIRFNPRHQRDDYRDAVAQARADLVNDRTVWWIADRQTALYYGLPSASSKLFLDGSSSSLEMFAEPDSVYLSKPDIYDPNQKVTSYLSKRNFSVARTLTAFQVFVKRPVLSTTRQAAELVAE